MLLLAVPHACSGGGKSVVSQLDELGVKATVQTDLRCDCYEVFPYPSKEDCVADNSFIANTPEEQACRSAALGRNATASQETMDCLLNALTTGSSCYADTLVCGDLMDTLGACDDEMRAALELCPAWTDLVQTALDAC